MARENGRGVGASHQLQTKKHVPFLQISIKLCRSTTEQSSEHDSQAQLVLYLDMSVFLGLSPITTVLCVWGRVMR